MLRKTLIITDVTAMSSDHVCIAGYDDSLTCIRPVLSSGQITKRHLFKGGELIIFPGAKVAFNFGSKISHPPHVEDVVFEETSIEQVGNATAKEWEEVLRKTAVKNIVALFPNIRDRCVPPESEGPSVGTLVPAKMPSFNCDYYKDPPRLRMRFVDHGGTVQQSVPITDLLFRELIDSLLKRHKGDCAKIVKLLKSKLWDRRVYLRLGLTRRFWGGCWLQVNGIHTFPNLYDRDYSEWIRLE